MTRPFDMFSDDPHNFYESDEYSTEGMSFRDISPARKATRGEKSACYACGGQPIVCSCNVLTDLVSPSPYLGSASSCIVSPRGLFRVYRYHTFEGQGGAPISVTVNFTFRPSETTYLRIVVGRKALNTTVRQLPKLGVWELEAIVPHYDDEQPQTAVMPITAQALTETNGVLDAVTVGSYTYWLRESHFVLLFTSRIVPQSS